MPSCNTFHSLQNLLLIHLASDSVWVPAPATKIRVGVAVPLVGFIHLTQMPFV